MLNDHRSGPLAIVALFLAACGGGGGGSSPPPTPAATVSLAASPASVTTGGTTSLSWSSTNATSCTASGGWSGSKATNGSETSAALTANTTFTLNCTGAGGSGSANASVTVTAPPAPTVTLTATPNPVTSGSSTNLTWSSTNATSCTASGGWSGSKATNGSETSAALTADTTFTLNCTGAGGSGSANASVTVTAPPAPTVTLTAAPNPVTIGFSANLTWSTTNATSCTASGGWSGSRATLGSELTQPIMVATTFTLSCTGAGGTGNASVTVNAVQPLPFVQMFANPSTVASGGSANLTWNTMNATTCDATGGSAGWAGTNKGISGSFATGPLAVTTVYTLTCTGPGGSTTSSATITVVNNTAPTANAGADSSTLPSVQVTLSGAGSSDPDGTINFYIWTQIAGPTVTLLPSGTDASFTAPTVTASTVLTFRLQVTDNFGATGTDTVDVTVQPLAAGQVAVSGRITFARIPVTLSGWNYAGTVQQPARGITVELVNGASQVAAAGATDSNGSFALAVPANTTLTVRAVAQLLRTTAPHTWNVRVYDIVEDANGVFQSASPTYTVSSASFSSGSGGATQNLAIQSGWGTSPGPATGPRDAAPFAVLDTMYRALVRLQSLNASMTLPPLAIDWSTTNTGGRTFFIDSDTVAPNTFGPKIVLAGEANADTDEYDAQVVAHEIGHYVEWHFGRSDSIGGPHRVGDRLDPRVAWGEGFGYYFAGLVNDDPLMLDSFGSNQAQVGNFNIETRILNPGWWSESSVWAILWDLYDSANDSGGADGVSIGAVPIWATLTGPARSTDAFTTIFTFINRLKQSQQADANLIASINSLVNFHNIDAAVVDDFATQETHNAGFAEVLPLYRPITLSATPISVPSSVLFTTDSENGTDNKLGNRKYLRLDLPAGRTTVRITASTSIAGKDPDVIVYRQGAYIGSGETAANEDFTLNNLIGGATYLLEVYECNNAGCSGDNPNPGNVTISLTVQ